jgi:organic hydroperoxide reductase OsmC/OhrA
MTVHRYTTTLSWEGSTSGGYRDYSRAHTAAGLALSADPAFRGDPELLNPEQLVVAAASSCQLLSFLAVAARHGVDVLAYDDRAEAEMDARQSPVRINVIRLHPTIRVAEGTDHAKVLHLVEVAHQDCFIANSLNSEITIDATVVH